MNSMSNNKSKRTKQKNSIQAQLVALASRITMLEVTVGQVVTFIQEQVKRAKEEQSRIIKPK